MNKFALLNVLTELYQWIWSMYKSYCLERGILRRSFYRVGCSTRHEQTEIGRFGSDAFLLARNMLHEVLFMVLCVVVGVLCRCIGTLIYVVNILLSFYHVSYIYIMYYIYIYDVSTMASFFLECLERNSVCYFLE